MGISGHENAVAAWAASRYTKVWQLDALRRVLEVGSTTDGDVVDLTRMVEVAAGAHPGPSPAARPPTLAAHSLTPVSAPTAAAPPPVRLGRMRALRHVNARAANQEVTFALLGLTAIYGENGTGKTGYSRVLRRACRPWRTKEVKPILTSVRGGGPGGVPEARFDVELADGDLREVSWRQGASPPSELTAFAVFDARCVRPLIAEENVVTHARPVRQVVQVGRSFSGAQRDGRAEGLLQG